MSEWQYSSLYYDAGVMTGYARVEQGQDEDEQRTKLVALGAARDHLFIDVGLTGTRRDLPHRAAMLAALAPGDTVIVTGAERLARSAAELGKVAATMRERHARLNIAGAIYDPNSEGGRVAFDLLVGLFPAFEAGIYELRLAGPREKAKAAGRYPGGKSKITDAQRRQIYDLHEAGKMTVAELQKRFDLSRSSVYAQLQIERTRRAQKTPGT